MQHRFDFIYIAKRCYLPITIFIQIKCHISLRSPKTDCALRRRRHVLAKHGAKEKTHAHNHLNLKWAFARAQLNERTVTIIDILLCNHAMDSHCPRVSLTIWLFLPSSFSRFVRLVLVYCERWTITVWNMYIDVRANNVEQHRWQGTQHRQFNGIIMGRARMVNEKMWCDHQEEIRCNSSRWPRCHRHHHCRRRRHRLSIGGKSNTSNTRTHLQLREQRDEDENI